MSSDLSGFNVSTAATNSNTTTTTDAQTEDTSVSQSNQTAAAEQKASINWETSPINEEPQSTQEGAGQEPSAQTNYPVTASLIPIAVLLGIAVAIAFGGPLDLMKRKR
jgi:cobalamin biosynthesis Mg chelatase CobN